MKIYKKIFSIFLITLININDVSSGSVIIINKSDTNVRLDVVSDPGFASFCKVCLDNCRQINGRHAVKIRVPQNAFTRSNFFSIADMTNGFLGSSACKHLNVFKNYEVIFSSTMLGTTCKYKEI